MPFRVSHGAGNEPDRSFADQTVGRMITECLRCRRHLSFAVSNSSSWWQRIVALRCRNTDVREIGSELAGISGRTPLRPGAR
jgi:hypothetical protein